MKLTLKKSGGFAQPLAASTKSIDATQLSEVEARTLESLVEAATRNTAPPSGARSSRVRDAMHYQIDVLFDDGHETRLRGSDPVASSEFAELLSWMETFGQ